MMAAQRLRKHNNFCLGCNKSGRFEFEIVPTTPGRGIVGWCKSCDDGLNLGTKKSIIATIVNNWDGDYDNELQAALDYLDDKARQLWQLE